MGKAGYSAVTEAAIALAAAATAKSIIGVQAPSSSGIDLKHASIGFDGVSASEKPILVELCYATFATNAPGTNSTNLTERIKYGRQIAANAVAASGWTTEPTVLTVIEEKLITPNGGYWEWAWPLGDTPDSAVSEGFVIRCTIPTGGAAVNARATLTWERC